jgi:hypothetical protein
MFGGALNGPVCRNQGVCAEAAIRCALQNGDSGMHKIAAAFGVGAGTVQRIKAEMSTPA